MGSEQHLKRARREPRAGKVDALLDAKLKGVEWGSKEYFLKDLFIIKRGKRLTVEHRIKGDRPLVTAGYENTGVAEYIGNKEQEIFPKDTITIDMFANTFFRNYSYSADDNILVLFEKNDMKYNVKIFITAIINKILYKKFSYGKQFRMGSFNKVKIQLPTKNNEIDFEFMENFIAELEAQKIERLEVYLVENGLKEYRLSQEEEEVLRDFESGNIEWGEFKYKNIFDNIKQGRRLKKDDHIQGDIPFVMAGTTNTGVANYISNPIAFFPKNSITIDIFGNTFYRSYDFGAGDDTGVYWSSENKYLKEEMLFFTVSMAKSVLGKFDYGTKLRSSQSVNFEMKLPTKNNQPDYALMQMLISAVQKLVLKDVVLYVEGKRRG